MPELSELAIKRDECPKCGARWLDGQLYWATGAKAKEEDLAGLVCNTANSPKCINPKKGVEGGDTWAKREMYLGNLERVAEKRMKPQWDAGVFGFED